jgi:single-stranded-DNA-specific exonuclease
LLDSAGRSYQRTVAADFGFVIAPRLNASGRLDDISTGIECLLSGDGASARHYAATLEDINSERKSIEQEMQSRAIEIVGALAERHNTGAGQQQIPSESGFCLFDPGWHQGVTGLVASRIKERTGQPVVAFANNSDGMLTGSARSIPGLHIKDLFEVIATSSPGLLKKFGGHAMAAGLTIAPDRLADFEKLFSSNVKKHFAEFGNSDTIFTDGELAEQDITLGNAEEIRNAAPWGQGFPVPQFEGVFRVSEMSVVGGIHLKMKLCSEDMTKYFDAIAFRAIEPGQEVPQFERVHAIYQLDVNEFRGKKRLQLLIDHFFPLMPG